MKIKLVSNFRDYYDYWFDLEGDVEFKRISTGGMSRPDMLKYLSSHDIPTPFYGYVKEFTREIDPMYHDLIKVIVHTNPNTHWGEGKELMTLEEAAEKYPDSFITFYEDTGRPAESIRDLYIGGRVFRMRYKSDDSWRSNVGNVEIGIISRWPLHRELKDIGKEYPLFAIDYVSRQRRGMEPTNMPWYVAVDFNEAPGLKGTGIENILDATEVVDLIRTWYTKNMRKAKPKADDGTDLENQRGE